MRRVIPRTAMWHRISLRVQKRGICDLSGKTLSQAHAVAEIAPRIPYGFQKSVALFWESLV